MPPPVLPGELLDVDPLGAEDRRRVPQAVGRLRPARAGAHSRREGVQRRVPDRGLDRDSESATGGREARGLDFDSQGRDFDERDRELALTLRPHVDALWRRSILRRQAAELAAALERDGKGAARQAIVLFEAGGRIDHATPEARALLAAWFGTTNGRLPREVQEWLATAARGDCYTERRNGSILTVEAAGDFTLTLRERHRTSHA